MKKFFIIVVIALIMILSGCVDQNQGKVENQDNKIVETNSNQLIDLIEETSEVTTTEDTTESTTEITTEVTSNSQETTEVTTTENQTEVTTAISVNNNTGAKSQSTAQATNTATNTTNTTSTADTTKEKQYRIVATSPATCDIMDRLGIDLVGVPTSTIADISDRYKNATRIGTAMAPDMEIISSLKPTDVVGPDSLEDDLKVKYQNIGVNYTFINLRSVYGLYDSIKILGQKFGKESEANALITDYNNFINSYKQKNSGKESPKVLVLMGLPGSYVVATNKSYAGSLVELAGGTNVFTDNEKDFLNINPEEMLAKNPDIIIRTAHAMPEETMKMFDKEFKENDIWKHFKAVENGKVYNVDYTKFGMSATFEYKEALQELQPILYGE